MAPKTVYLLFPTGGGGNHLGNILSLTPGFKPRFKAEKDYETELLGKYLHTNRLISSTAIDCIPDWESTSVHFHLTDGDTLRNHPGINIVCNHVNIFIGQAVNSSNWHVDETDIIVLSTYPEPDSFMYNRVTEPNWFGRHDPSENYILANFSQLTTAIVKQFDINLYASENGFEYAKTFFHDNFGIVLSDLGKELHALWWSNINTKLHGPEKVEIVEEVKTVLPEEVYIQPAKSVQSDVNFKVNRVLDIYRP